MIIFRRLNHDDYDEIVEISKDIWEGADYLPSVFHEWVDSPGYFIGALDEKSNRIIGTSKFSILHDQSGWLEGLRVASSHRGQKIASLLTDHILKIAMDAYENGVAKSIGFSTHITSQASIKLMTDRGFKIVSEQVLITKSYDNAESINPHNFVVTPWMINENELNQYSEVVEHNGIFNFAFTYQTVTAGLIKELNDKKIPLCINGHKGFYQIKGEPNVLSFEGTYDGIDTFMQYALHVNHELNRPEPLTYISSANHLLIERLNENGYKSFNNWNNDYYHFEFQR